MYPGLIPAHAAKHFRRFDLEMWQQKGRQVYWRTTAPDESSPSEGFNLPSGGSLSSDTLINAFFSAHWWNITRVDSLSLLLNYRGNLLVEIFAHLETGEALLIHSEELKCEDDGEFRHNLSVVCAPLRYSFRLRALKSGGRLIGGAWQTSSLAAPVCLGIMVNGTRNRKHVERVIQCLRNNPELKAESSKLTILVLQDEHDDSNRGVELANCLTINQRDLGETAAWVGGVMEMLETSQLPSPTHFLLVADELFLDCDTILRVIRMNQFLKSSTILNGLLVDLCRPNKVYSYADVVARNDESHYVIKSQFANLNVANSMGLDVLSLPFNQSSRIGRYSSVPSEVFSRIGFPMRLLSPAFEEVEFAIRASKGDFPAYTVPSIGGWHSPAYTKKSSVMETHYMEPYSSLIFNALQSLEACSSYFARLGSVAASYILKSQYQYASARVLALEDFILGWSFFTEARKSRNLLRTKISIDNYELNDSPPSQRLIIKSQIVDLKKRLEKVLVAFEEKKYSLQNEFEEQMPTTFTAQSWQDFFQQNC